MKGNILLKISGGIGDNLVVLPAIKKLSENYNVDILLRDPNRGDYAKDTIEDICMYNPHVNEIIHYEDYGLYKKSVYKRYDKTFPLHMFYYDQEQILKDNKHRYQLIGDIVGVECSASDIDVYLQDFEINKAKDFLKQYKKTIVINPAKLRSNEILNEGKFIDEKYWLEIIKSFPDITFLHLGLSLDAYEIDEPNVVNLVNKTSIRESIAILLESDYFILTDGFLQHVAGGASKKGITIWGATSPYTYGYDTSINLWYHPGCAPCRIQDPNYIVFDRPCCMRYTGIPVNVKEVTELVSEEF